MLNWIFLHLKLVMIYPIYFAVILLPFCSSGFLICLFTFNSVNVFFFKNKNRKHLFSKLYSTSYKNLGDEIASFLLLFYSTFKIF